MNAWLFLVRWRSSAITASEAREMCAKIRNYGGPIINGSLNLENICAPEIIQGLNTEITVLRGLFISSKNASKEQRKGIQG